MDKNVFVVKDLSFAYGEKPVIRHLNFRIPKGKIVTIMGANGCGKSTLFQLMTKNRKPDGGAIYLEGRDIADIGLRSFAEQVAVVHQYNSAPEDLTVKKLVSYGRTPYLRFGHSDTPELDRRMIDRAMKITGIMPTKDRFVSELSGGQRQRVWIAMALAQGTDTLLLDEPTTYLDVRYQLQVLRLLKALKERYHVTIVMVLHDMNQALAYSDEIVALSPAGELVVQGKPEDVITSESLKRMYGIQLEVVNLQGKPHVITV